MDNVNISVNLNGRIYQFQVKPEYESKIREAINRVNLEITEFKKKYQISNEIDVLSLVLLKIIAQNVAMETMWEDFEEKWKKEMKKWEKILEK